MTLIRKSFIATLAFCASFAQSAGAMYLLADFEARHPDQKLWGITSIDLLVERMPPAALPCQIAKDSIEEALEQALLSAGIALTKAGQSSGSLYANLNAIEIGPGQCAVSLSLTFSRPLFLANTSTASSVWATVWSDGMLLTVSAQGGNPRVASAVLRLGNRFTSALKGARERESEFQQTKARGQPQQDHKR